MRKTLVKMTIAHQIVALNKEGICHLHDRRFRSAITCFRSAVELLDETVQVSQVQVDVRLPVDPVQLEVVPEDHHDSLSPNNIFSFFQQALSFEADYIFFHRHSNTMTVLLYNLGLTYHALAMSGFTGYPSHAFSKALDCYKLALSVLSDLEGPATDKDIVLPALALLVNTGHICSHHYRIAEAQACRDHLRGLLESKTGSLGLSDLQEAYFIGELAYSFYLNCAVAPAA